MFFALLMDMQDPALSPKGCHKYYYYTCLVNSFIALFKILPINNSLEMESEFCGASWLFFLFIYPPFGGIEVTKVVRVYGFLESPGNGCRQNPMVLDNFLIYHRTQNPPKLVSNCVALIRSHRMVMLHCVPTSHRKGYITQRARVHDSSQMTSSREHALEAPGLTSAPSISECGPASPKASEQSNSHHTSSTGAAPRPNQHKTRRQQQPRMLAHGSSGRTKARTLPDWLRQLAHQPNAASPVGHGHIVVLTSVAVPRPVPRPVPWTILGSVMF
ncbi:hypothetical protein BDZ91DRAFT_780023 [Kalaharituber pfeilii]|nr:hypothetical protein BDZ91DRAFT_780023 [Kalaharituber pfeilii]